MKVAVLDRPYHFRIEDRPIPGLESGEALIKVRAAGICGSDLHFYTGELPFDQEMIRGHEVSGVIEDPGVTQFKPGQSVVVNPLISCGDCPSCGRGEPHLCENVEAIGGNYPGGFAEYITAPSQNIQPFNADLLPFHHAALTDCVGVSVHSLNKAGFEPGETVLVLGDGTIGLLIAQAALASGAGKVIIIGKHKKNLNAASRSGVPLVINIESEEDPAKIIKKNCGPVDVVFETIGRKSPPLSLGLSILRKGGRLAVLGLTGEKKIEIPWLDIVLGEKSILGVLGYGMYRKEDEFSNAISLMESGRFDLEPIITHLLPLDRVKDGFEAMLNKSESDCIKAVILHKD